MPDDEYKRGEVLSDNFDGNRLLIEISTKLNGLIDRFDAASQGDGFTRCVNRAERIKRLEQDVIAIKNDKAEVDDLNNALSPIRDEVLALKKSRTEFDTWLMRLTWATIICGVVKVAFFPGVQM
jgi:hypothetical protein